MKVVVGTSSRGWVVMVVVRAWEGEEDTSSKVVGRSVVVVMMMDGRGKSREREKEKPRFLSYYIDPRGVYAQCREVDLD